MWSPDEAYDADIGLFARASLNLRKINLLPIPAARSAADTTERWNRGRRYRSVCFFGHSSEVEEVRVPLHFLGLDNQPFQKPKSSRFLRKTNVTWWPVGRSDRIKGANAISEVQSHKH